MSPSPMPGESPFSPPSISIQTLSPLVKRLLLWLLSHWFCPTLTQFSPRSTSSSTIAEWNRYSPPPRPHSAPGAGNSSTPSIISPTCSLPVPSARSPTPKPSITALTLPFLRVVTSNLSSAAACPPWHAFLTVKKSTLCALGIALPAQKPLSVGRECLLDRGRTAKISLKTRLALQRSLVQYPTLLYRPRNLLYSHVMLCLLGSDPNVSSRTLSQEKVMMDPSIPTPPKALRNNGEFLH